MTISELVLLLEKNDPVTRTFAIGLDSDTHFFLSLFLTLLKDRNFTVQLSTVHSDFELSSLQISFLGTSLIYLLDIRDLDEKKKFATINYVRGYTGPHQLVLLINEQINGLPLVELFQCTLSLYNQLFSLFYPSYVRKNNQHFIEKMFQQLSVIPLDTACILMQYHIVLGNNITQFINEWLEDILIPEKSLFILSTHFFAKNAALFWKYWDRIKDDYPDVFWITFWSEQLFRAHGYIWYNKKKSSEMKAISYRLPFSFTQRDFKKYTNHELAKAHDRLYQIDYHIKNGAVQPLELFYLQFLLDTFK